MFKGRWNDADLCTDSHREREVAVNIMCGFMETEKLRKSPWSSACRSGCLPADGWSLGVVEFMAKFVRMMVVLFRYHHIATLLLLCKTVQCWVDGWMEVLLRPLTLEYSVYKKRSLLNATALLHWHLWRWPCWFGFRIRDRERNVKGPLKAIYGQTATQTDGQIERLWMNEWIGGYNLDPNTTDRGTFNWTGLVVFMILVAIRTI